MAFAATRTDETIMGNKRVVYGSFTNDATSGTIDTGLNAAEYAQVTGATILAQSAGTLTVTLAATSTSGFWMAWGSD